MAEAAGRTAVLVAPVVPRDAPEAIARRALERNSLAILISLELGRRCRIARYMAVTRVSSDIAFTTSLRPATARAASTEIGLFMKNSAWDGTMVELRFELAASGSA